MNQDSLLIIMTVAVSVSAVALVIQMGLLFGMFKATQTVRDRLLALLPKIEGLVDASRVAVDESRAGVAEIREKSNKLLDAAHKQVQQLESVLTDATERTRRQLDHAEILVEDAMGRIEETVALVHQGILKPLRGITGIVAGVRTAVQYLLRGNRPSPDQVTVDEEMFI
jgi:hypothetical protein